MTFTTQNEPSSALSCDRFEKVKLQNCLGYSNLFDIEVLLREVLYCLLSREYGIHWVKRGLPEDIKNKVLLSRKHELGQQWSNLTSYQPLYYVDFPDLKKIILFGTNWNTIFVRFFKNKSSADALFSELEPVRNRIAHNRFISQRDLNRVSDGVADILNVFPLEIRGVAKDTAGLAVPVIEQLRILLVAISGAVSSISRHERNDDSLIQITTITESWWFTEDYLLTSVQEVVRFQNGFVEYSGIVDGLGQAYAREKFSQSTSLLQTAADASTAVDELLKLEGFK